MKVKTKVIFHLPLIFLWHWRAKRIARKLLKEENQDRYPIQWRNDLVIKRCRFFLKLVKVKLEVVGYENIPKQPSIITPNHSSSFDPIILLAALTNPEKGPDYLNHKTIFIAKEELRRNKRTKGYANLIDTFYFSRNNPREALEVFNGAIHEAKESKRHIVVFPEGTRSINGQIQEFKSGAFRIAKKGFLPILPVTINNSLTVSDRSRKQVLNVQIIFHAPLKPVSFMSAENKGLAERVRKIVLTKWVEPQGKRSNFETKLA